MIKFNTGFYNKNKISLLIKLIILIILMLIWSAISFSFVFDAKGNSQLNNGLTQVGDAYSESGSIRAAHGYLKNGFLSNMGLPDICYGNAFNLSGWKSESKLESCIYTHYPPGPDILLALSMKVFGENSIDKLRLTPLIFGLFCTTIFFWVLLTILGLGRGILLACFCLALPLFCNSHHVLHYQGYAFSLQLLLISLSVLYTVENRDLQSNSLPTLYASLLALIGFLNGWLSFDRFFLVAFTPLAIWAVLNPYFKIQAKFALKSCAVTAIFFGIAHLMHLFQNAFYFNSIQLALRDLISAAAYRSADAPSGIGRIELLHKYFTEYSIPFFGFNLEHYFLFLFSLILLIWILREKYSVKILFFGLPKNIPLNIILTALIVPLIISCLWYLIMLNHSAIHGFFLPAHLFTVWFLITFFFFFPPISENS